ncbi:LpqB family beta-propeller domain-containing protein [Silvibacterium acidisoli]|uniref:LpqB family beta-propeller domain-containing protein n=1 Tax=Acidobacteriaceae bacterium ZG23-2 TaxID=2883246 RepID=UPI00406CE1A0
MVRFLRFVVEQTLLENAQNLKERQIGIEVFDRPADWDPKTDNVVRSEARRLRAKLEAYAASGSSDETIRITVPKGGYVATFTDLASEREDLDHGLAAAVVSSPPITPHSAPWWRNTVVPLSALLIASITVLLFIAYKHDPVSASIGDSFEVVPFSDEIGQQFSPSISPDGDRIAYVWDGNGDNYDIYIKQLKTGAVSRITNGPGADIHPAWSPDGNQLAFLRQASGGDEVVVTTQPGGQERVVAHVRDNGGMWASNNPLSGCQSLAWSPDGKQLLLTDKVSSDRSSGLVRMALDSGQEQPLTSPPGQDEDCYPRISPDGKQIAFVRYISHGSGEVFTMSDDGSRLHQITRAQADIRGLDWTRDGQQLVYASSRRGSYELREINRDGGDSQPLPADTDSASDPAIARTGNWMAFVDSNENWNIWRVPVHDGHLGHPERFLSSSGHNHSPSMSPDQSTVAFVSDRSGTPEIWFANGDGTHIRQMTHYGGPWLGSIRWSPDSKAIVFDARPSGHSAIFRLPVTGGTPVPVEQGAFEARRPYWSRDGNFIYFDTTQTGEPQIWKRSVSTGASAPVEPRGSLAPQESFDSKTIFFTGNAENQALWTSEPDGSRVVRLDNVRPEPTLDWSVGPAGIYFAQGLSESSVFYFYSFLDRRVHELGELPQTLSLGTPSLVVSHDGKWILYAAIDHTRSIIKLRKETATSQVSEP